MKPKTEYLVAKLQNGEMRLKVVGLGDSLTLLGAKDPYNIQANLLYLEAIRKQEAEHGIGAISLELDTGLFQSLLDDKIAKGKLLNTAEFPIFPLAINYAIKNRIPIFASAENQFLYERALLRYVANLSERSGLSTDEAYTRCSSLQADFNSIMADSTTKRIRELQTRFPRIVHLGTERQIDSILELLTRAS